MASMKRPRLKAVAALPDYRLDLTFVDGSRHFVSLANDVERLPGLSPLKDPEAFAGAQVIEGEGWTVEWEAFDIQIGADTLLLEALAQTETDDNTRTFLSWRARNGLSLAEAGRALGLTPRTISAYGTGARKVPRYIALACKGWEAERAH
ncbi:MAG: DUF2442 domain-containing protein [Deltaproteobacteria bacterium]|nr:DUF2442 domain-containing protein [Deltaproteobacteria bacterium]